MSGWTKEMHEAARRGDVAVGALAMMLDEIESGWGRPRLCVACLVTDPDGCVLLVRTRRGWELPGGKVQSGERWHEALRRELKEETLLDVEIIGGDVRAFDWMVADGAQCDSVALVARGTARGEPAPTPDDSVLEAAWFHRDAIPWESLSALPSAQALREWAEEQGQPWARLKERLAGMPELRDLVRETEARLLDMRHGYQRAQVGREDAEKQVEGLRRLVEQAETLRAERDTALALLAKAREGHKLRATLLEETVAENGAMKARLAAIAAPVDVDAEVYRRALSDYEREGEGRMWGPWIGALPSTRETYLARHRPYVEREAQLQRALAAAEERAAKLAQEAVSFARDIANGYDHEEDAHKCNNGACRVCNAEKALAKLSTFGVQPPRAPSACMSQRNDVLAQVFEVVSSEPVLSVIGNSASSFVNRTIAERLCKEGAPSHPAPLTEDEARAWASLRPLIERVAKGEWTGTVLGAITEAWGSLSRGEVSPEARHEWPVCVDCATDAGMPPTKGVSVKGRCARCGAGGIMYAPAAVVALAGIDPPQAPSEAPTPADIARWKLVAERVIAEHAAASIGKTCERYGCENAPGSGEPRPAVARVDGVHFCDRHAPRESDYGMARVVLGLLVRPMLTEEQAREIAERVALDITRAEAVRPSARITAALLRVSRGDYGPTIDGPRCACGDPAVMHDHNVLGEHGAYYCERHADECDVAGRRVQRSSPEATERLAQAARASLPGCATVTTFAEQLARRQAADCGGCGQFVCACADLPVLAKPKEVPAPAPGEVAVTTGEAEEHCAVESVGALPTDCEHQKTEPLPGAHEGEIRCLGCGIVFLVCKGCSEASGSGRPVYHAPPLCEGSEKPQAASGALEELLGQVGRHIEGAGGVTPEEEAILAEHSTVPMPPAPTDEALHIHHLGSPMPETE